MRSLADVDIQVFEGDCRSTESHGLLRSTHRVSGQGPLSAPQFASRHDSACKDGVQPLIFSPNASIQSTPEPEPEPDRSIRGVMKPDRRLYDASLLMSQEQFDAIPGFASQLKRFRELQQQVDQSCTGEDHVSLPFSR